jgi:succinoglycan biosynthesis protein ExoW
MTTAAAVIIPYYQEKPGILRRALTSVLQQKLPPDVNLDIIVVDDGSPAPARAEIEGLNFAGPFNLRLIEQPNGGVGAARNTGLRNVSTATDYIAFLDSDDIWNPDHLAAALSALDSDFDFYFCDNRRIGQFESQFATMANGGFLANAGGQLISGNLYEISKEKFIHYALRSFVFQLSTVVYLQRAAPGLVFDSSLQCAGEDHLFLLQLAYKVQHIGFSPAICVTCAEGINIYYSTLNWDDPGHLMRYLGMALTYNQIRKKFTFSHDDQKHIAAKLRQYRLAFAFLTVRYFLKKRELWPPGLVKMTRYDSRFWLWYPLCILCVSVRFPLGLYDPVKGTA